MVADKKIRSVYAAPATCTNSLWVEEVIIAHYSGLKKNMFVSLIIIIFSQAGLLPGCVNCCAVPIIAHFVRGRMRQSHTIHTQKQ